MSMNEDHIKMGFSYAEWELLQRVLSSNGKIEKAILYGSRAKGNFKKFSDVDIALVGPQLLRIDIIRLNESFSESSFPYETDLSLFSRLKNEQLIDHIRRNGIVIYSRQHAKEQTP